MDNLLDPKVRLRQDLRARRRALSPVLRQAAAVKIAAYVLDDNFITPQAVVAGYYPLADECDVLPLLALLGARGHKICLPVTAPRGQPLSFREWTAGQKLTRSAFGVMEPLDGAAVIPDVLVVPLLGFDAQGHRLGYGAGHYDRTIADLRRGGHSVRTMGAAFSCQRLAENLPVEPHDVALDCIATEDGLYWPAK